MATSVPPLSQREALDTAAAKPDQAQLHNLAKEAAGSESIAALKYSIILTSLPVSSTPVSTSIIASRAIAVPRLTGASAFAKVELVKSLLARGADPNLENCGWGQFYLKPLTAAARGWVRDEDAAEAMKVLMDGGARWEGSAALQLAAKAGKVECAKLLVGRGADVDEIVTRVEGKSALRLAEGKGCEEVVGILNAQGAKDLGHVS